MRTLLAALTLAHWAGPTWAEMQYLGSYELTQDARNFGGFSGIEMSGNGHAFIAITDRGFIMPGQIARGPDTIEHWILGPLRALRLPDGRDATVFLGDSEGLAMGTDGIRVISYEGWTRVRAELEDGTPLSRLPDHPDFQGMQGNGSLEALAIDQDGTLYAIPERSGRAMRPFPVYRLVSGAPQWDIAFTLPRSGLFVPVGADIGPDGQLYLLERDFNALGFSTRIRRFALDGSGGEVLLETSPGVHDNLEGIALWQDDQGLRITMISDDNFRRLQRTELVEYRLTH